MKFTVLRALVLCWAERHGWAATPPQMLFEQRER